MGLSHFFPHHSSEPVAASEAPLEFVGLLAFGESNHWILEEKVGLAALEAMAGEEVEVAGDFVVEEGCTV